VQLIAQFLQPIIDDVINGPDNLLGTADDINKIILVTHLQQFQIDLALAPLLRGVDIILAGGSDTILADANDPLRPGDTAAFPYPVQVTAADGRPTLLVNTAGTYNYLGRLVVQFDDDGVIIPASLDPAINGAYATTDAVTFSTIGLTDLNGDGVINDRDLRLFDPNRDGISKAGLAGQLTDAVLAVVATQDGNIVGDTSVFLEGRREKVRTEETNLGNLTADANLAYAKAVDSRVILSLKNGGGIRDIIGAIQNDTTQNPPVTNFLPPLANPVANKQEGDISQLDIAGSLRFNNVLTLLTITQQQLYWLFEAAVATVAPGQTPGNFPQVAGVRFSYDPTKPGLQELRTEPAGSTRVFDASGVLTPEFQTRLANGQGRIRNLALVNESGVVTEVIVKDGQFVGSASDTLRIVTLNFLAGAPPSFTGTVPNLVDTVYPFTRWNNANPAFVNRVDIPNTGSILGNNVTFAAQGTEQDALAEYLFLNFNIARGKPSYSTPDVDAQFDQRIQNLAVAQDTVLATVANHELTAQVKSRISLASGAEIVSFDPVSKQLFVVSGGDKLTVLNAANPSNLTLVTTIDLAPFATTGGANYASGISANSVAVKDGIVAVAVAPNLGDTPNAAQRTEAGEQGKVLFFRTDGTFIREVLVGFLPDNLAFSPDGNKLVVANEGEPQGYQTGQVDPEGSVSIITFAGGVKALTATSALTNVNATFTAFNGQKAALEAQGAKFNGPNATLAQDAEPEYITISADSQTAFVTLQENNAVAVVDLVNGVVTRIIPLGFKDHSLPYNALDASDQDDGGFNPRSYPNLLGLYQPDAIASYTVGGVTYLVTANEGDGREYAGFVEEVRAAAVPGGLDAKAFPNPAGILDNEALGRLHVIGTNYNDSDGDPQREKLFSFGGRSFSIWNAQTGQLVYDSGNAFDTIAESIGIRDNGRDDNKGTEPEALAIGQIGDQIYAFIGLERTTRAAAILVYNITNPLAPRYVRAIAIPGDVSPEGLIFIKAEDSPSGKPLLVVANEVSNTVSVIELGVASETTILTGDAGNDVIYGGASNETILGEAGNDVLYGGAGKDTIVGGTGDDILVGEEGDDALLGEAGNDYIDGGAGNDYIEGGAGNDSLLGRSGIDVLLGGDGNDYMDGGAGNDVLIGGLGTDALVGGVGNDRFGFATGAPFTAATIGNDILADFNPLEDFIVLSKTTFTAFTTSSGSVFEGGTPIVAADFAVIATGGATAAGASSALIVYETSTGALFYNPDRATAGLGTGGQFATVSAAPTIPASRILIVD
jgi:alkaline phosphatase